MTSNNENGWAEYSKLVLKELETLNREQWIDKVADLYTQIANIYPLKPQQQRMSEDTLHLIKERKGMRVPHD